MPAGMILIRGYRQELFEYKRSPWALERACHSMGRIRLQLPSKKAAAGRDIEPYAACYAAPRPGPPS